MTALTKIPYDIHVHTDLSACCSDKDNQIPRNIIESAEKRQLKAIGFSDHLWVNPTITPSNWYKPQNENQILTLKKRLSSIESTIPILVGCEAETIAPGKFGITPEFANSLDYVLLSCSHFHMQGFVEQPKGSSAKEVGKHMLSFFESGVTSGLATAIAHPMLPLGYWTFYDDIVASISDAEFLDVFHLAAVNNVALEVTLAFFPTIVNVELSWSLETPLRFLTLAKQAGCKFTFGSDAHSLDRLEKLDLLMHFVDILSLAEDDILKLY